ncbi:MULTISPECIES: TylF/MycF/NovP-related O-methyltransferase [Spirulina sp. CCY15215]|uniref:TylF/MycF/NovP-related O-methyltransferase n=1 Tax=Spirulina sp. CCY15215 TaxID=2767591 RepID=UPI00194FDC99
MNQWQLQTPVVLIIFNRPDTTQRVFDAIRQARPPQLFIIADAARRDRTPEVEQCRDARNIVEGIDWDCQVFKNYSDTNLGCRHRISSGLNWVFENVEEAIILEDDCVPDPTFFRFCEELLEKYRRDDLIMAIAGNNFQFRQSRTEYSYYFSRYPHCWGWATWRRAWQHYDDTMQLWPRARDEKCLESVFETDRAVAYWAKILQRNYEGFNSWAYAWGFSCWIHDGLTILPDVNLVSNIGFGSEGTNTRKQDHKLAHLSTESLSFPLLHPQTIQRNREADRFTEDMVFSGTKVSSNAEQFQSSQVRQSDSFQKMFSNVLELAKRSLANPKISLLKNKIVAQFPFLSPSLRKVMRSIKSKNYEDAFATLNILKSGKTPKQNVDYLRSLCFLEFNQVGAAIQALYEELRYFPKNQKARQLLDQLLSENPHFQTGKIEDEEFQTFLRMVQPHTMLGEPRLYSLFSLTKQICLEDIPGNFVECGVAGGGGTLLIALTIKRYTKQPRFLYACDCFTGMPTPTEEDKCRNTQAESTGWGTGTCAASEEYIQQLCVEFGVSDIVKTVKGYFQETLPEVRSQVNSIALLHADGDWYQSTRVIFENLYDLVTTNGFIQVNDYGHWEGCRKAIQEFQLQRHLKFDITVLDSTGVYFPKPKFLDLSNLLTIHNKKEYLNLGCGQHFHPEWINIDFYANDPNVISYNLRQNIPFPNHSFQVVYHSHLLEHLPKSEAEPFLKECYRILKPNGVIRVVIPDLEQIARLYLKSLEEASKGSGEWAANYEWIMLEMYDQVVRNRSGGEMAAYLAQSPIPNEEFVLTRLGVEGEKMLNKIRDRGKISSSHREFTPEQVGRFRQGGEVHQWMYDRYSLETLLAKVNFYDIKLCQAQESRIVDFNQYHLDITTEGRIRKADSLFMEANK